MVIVVLSGLCVSQEKHSSFATTQFGAEFDVSPTRVRSYPGLVQPIHVSIEI
jgi:hypothetical protein